jgi:hypothetical protein
MGRQYYEDLGAEPPFANLTAITATTETALWNAARYTPIAPAEGKPGKIWNVHAGGIMSFAGTGTLIITPRFGLTVGAGITMGANVNAQTTPGATTANPWKLWFTAVVRTLGEPGANSTVVGTGMIIIGATGTAGTAVAIPFGGTVATVDLSVATGITIGWTLSVAGTCTPQYAYIQSPN